MTAQLIQVIEVTVSRGDGTKEDPYHHITEYWSVDGQFLADDADQIRKAIRRSGNDEPCKPAAE